MREPDATAVLRIDVEAPQGCRELCFEDADELSFGRDPQLSVVLDSPFVSRHHATLRREEGALWVEDHSSHGTVIDGRRLLGERAPLEPGAVLGMGPFRLTVSLSERLTDQALRRRVRTRLLSTLGPGELTDTAAGGRALRDRVRATLAEILSDLGRRGESPADEELLEGLLDEALGLGPLEALLVDERVTEIMVLDAATIYVERAGRLERSPQRFPDDAALRGVIERIVTPLGRRIDEASPIVDARLPDGSRVSAVIPPLALRGPTLTIRKRPSQKLDLGALVARGALSEAMAELLRGAVAVRRNVVISGGTGSGKTTLLNALSAAIPVRERVVTIEDAAELVLDHPHVVPLEARPENLEGQGAITIRDLVKAALRMRPDRIVVGECRGGEALDVLQAMNTGHEGSMTTTHANTCDEAVTRLETLCLLSGVALPLVAVRRQIASSVHLIVQTARFSDGVRRVTSISEVVGQRDDGGVALEPLYRFVSGEEAGGAPVFLHTGALPTFSDRLQGAFAEGSR